MTVRVRNRRLLVQALMRSGVIVEGDVLGEHAAQVAFVENQQMVETLVAQRADPAFGNRVGLRSAIGCQDDFDTFRAKDGVKRRGELGVPVVYEEAHGFDAGVSILEVPGQLTDLLGHPGLTGVCRTAGEMHATCAQLNEEEDVEGSQTEGLGGQEIAGEHLLRMRLRLLMAVAPWPIAARSYAEKCSAHPSSVRQ